MRIRGTLIGILGIKLKLRLALEEESILKFGVFTTWVHRLADQPDRSGDFFVFHWF